MKLSRRMKAVLGLAALALVVAPSAIAQPAGAPALAARSNDAGGIRVVVTPKSVAAGAAWQFEVVMDTHIKPLDDDLTKTAILVVDGGRQYAPTSWQGDKPGGHHRKGVLSFPAPSELSKSFELVIQNLGGITKRVFQWAK